MGDRSSPKAALGDGQRGLRRAQQSTSIARIRTRSSSPSAPTTSARHPPSTALKRCSQSVHRDPARRQQSRGHSPRSALRDRCCCSRRPTVPRASSSTCSSRFPQRCRQRHGRRQHGSPCRRRDCREQAYFKQSFLHRWASARTTSLNATGTIASFVDGYLTIDPHYIPGFKNNRRRRQVASVLFIELTGDFDGGLRLRTTSRPTSASTSTSTTGAEPDGSEASEAELLKKKKKKKGGGGGGGGVTPAR